MMWIFPGVFHYTFESILEIFFCFFGIIPQEWQWRQDSGGSRSSSNNKQLPLDLLMYIICRYYYCYFFAAHLAGKFWVIHWGKNTAHLLLFNFSSKIKIFPLISFFFFLGTEKTFFQINIFLIFFTLTYCGFHTLDFFLFLLLLLPFGQFYELFI